MYNVKIIDYGNEKQVRTYSLPIKTKEDRKEVSEEEKERIKKIKKENKEKRIKQELWTPFGFAEENLSQDELATVMQDLLTMQEYDKWEQKQKMENYKKSERSLRSSVNRTKQIIYKYARANIWEDFLTLTFNPNVVDRYDYPKVSKKVSRWLENQRRDLPDLKYLGVPEQHKDRAWHFHFLMSGLDESKIRDTGLVSIGKYTLPKEMDKQGKGKIIYDYERYKFGYSTVSKVEDSKKASSYITKYITKDLYKLSGGVKRVKRFWNSKNLDKPDESTLQLLPEEFKELIQSLDDQCFHKSTSSVNYGLVDSNGNDLPVEINYFELKAFDNF